MYQYVSLYGGLGNQLFQYTFAVYLLKNNKVKLDNFIYEEDKRHKDNIKKLNIEMLFAKKEEVKKFYIFNKKINNFLKLRSIKLLKISSKILFKNQIFEKKKILKNKKFVDQNIFNGYWQNIQYLKNIKQKKIQKIFNIKKTKRHEILINKIKSKKNSVALHIRSYQSDTFHKSMDKNYYKWAINYFNSKLKNPFFFIFTDNQNTKIFKSSIKNLKNYFVVNKFQDYEDLISMINCKNYIISNSTFGWWAAKLSYNRKRIVIVPKKWEFINSNCIEKKWIKI